MYSPKISPSRFSQYDFKAAYLNHMPLGQSLVLLIWCIKYGRDRLIGRRRNLIDRVVKCCKIPKEWKISHFKNQLKWYGLLLRMEDSRWPKKIYQWTPHGRRRIGRPQLSWRNQVTDFMKSRGMEEDMAENRHLWRLGVDRRLLAV